MPTIDSHPDSVPVWFDLSSSEPVAAAKFYGDLFNWDCTEPNEEFGGYATFSYQDKRIAGIGPKMAPDTPDYWGMYFQTSDIDASVKKVSEAGGSILVESMEIPELGKMAIVTDRGSNPDTSPGLNPHGAVFGFWEPQSHKGFQLYNEVSAPCYFELQTTDHAAAVDFYGQVLDSPVVTVSDTDEFRYSQLAQQGQGPGEGHAGIMDASSYLPPEVPSHWAIYIGVESADATAAKATELGGTVVQAPEDTPYGRLATISDPWGAMIKLHQVVES
ncbi:VOC family protein [Nocardia sp. 348MFTsu5.1]|uniref:VOC family protein n=1 Tax=Nocardia sp. 348MFTsu5.1 TaxID=1172185 RepID=UPI000369A1E7|nr:VOC family protein [Nocardia sp. 348MFTsu5.1]